MGADAVSIIIPTYNRAALVCRAVDNALAQTDGRGLVIAAGCVLPMETPDATVAAVIRRLGGPLKPVPGATSR